MTDSDTLKIFAIVLFLVILALVSMGCVENRGDAADNSMAPIYDGSQTVGAQTPPTAENQDAGVQANQYSHTGNYTRRTDSSRQFNSSWMQQAAIDACAGKSAGGSCTLSFGSAGGPTPGFNGTRGGSPPAGAAGPTGMPDGNMTAPRGGAWQPTGTCEASDNSEVLSCKTQMPTGIPAGG